MLDQFLINEKKSPFFNAEFFSSKVYIIEIWTSSWYKLHIDNSDDINK